MTADERFDALMRIARDKGIRITSPRVAILRALASSDDHPDAVQLLDRAREHEPSMSAASVYRAMRVFEDEGVVVRHEWQGRGRFEEADREAHLHIIDVVSGDIAEVQSTDVEAVLHHLVSKSGFELVDYRLDLFARRKSS